MNVYLKKKETNKYNSKISILNIIERMTIADMVKIVDRYKSRTQKPLPNPRTTLLNTKSTFKRLKRSF